MTDLLTFIPSIDVPCYMLQAVLHVTLYTITFQTFLDIVSSIDNHPFFRLFFQFIVTLYFYFFKDNKVCH